MPELDGKVAIVTGAGSGIGRASAIALAQAGALVIISDIAEGPGQDTVDLIGYAARFVHTDVSTLGSVEALVDETIQIFGRLDIAHNNAAIAGKTAPLTETSPEEWAKVIGINLTGVFNSLHAGIPALRQFGGGSIINTASILGIVALPNQGHYTATKHAVIGLTKAAALEVARDGIRVNALLRGPVHTAIQDALEADTPGYIEQMAGSSRSAVWPPRPRSPRPWCGLLPTGPRSCTALP